MSLKAMGIEHKRLEGTLVATIGLVLKTRDELPPVLDELRRHIPVEHIVGPPFCVFQFVTSVKQGFDAAVGFPVSRPVEAGRIKTRALPALEVLSFMHRGPFEELRESYGKLYGSTAAQGLISDEFCREVYWNLEDHYDSEIEVQFVLHNWNELLRKNLERVVDEETRRQVLAGDAVPTVESTLEERFRWVKGVVGRLDKLADEGQKYDVVSSCAHVFPKGQIDKLKAVYESTRAKMADPLDAVDAVIAFMAQDPGWGERPRREGHVIYSSKSPRDAQGYAKATTREEKRQTYCFCPLVRSHLDQGMPPTFCYCGAGWYRQQWEGATGKSVRIEIAQSLLKGDDVCQFAIHLPEDL
jgi:effector-binding domain-containing protein